MKYLPVLTSMFLLCGCFSPSLPEPCEPYVREAYERANAGDAQAQYALGSYLQRGDGVPAPDVSGAVYWYEKSIEQGCVPARNNLANIYLYGDENFRNEEKGRALLSAGGLDDASESSR